MYSYIKYGQMNSLLLLGKSLALRMSNSYGTKKLKTVSHVQDRRNKGTLYKHLVVRHSVSVRKTSKYYEDKILRFYIKYAEYSSVKTAYALLRVVRRFFGATSKLSSLTLNHLINRDVKYYDELANSYYIDIKAHPILEGVQYVVNKEGSCYFASGKELMFAYTGRSYNTPKNSVVTLVVHNNHKVVIFVYTYSNTGKNGSIVLSSMYEADYVSTFEDNLSRAKLSLGYLFDMQKGRLFLRRLPNEVKEGFSSIDNKGYYRSLEIRKVNINGSKGTGFKEKVSKDFSRRPKKTNTSNNK